MNTLLEIADLINRPDIEVKTEIYRKIDFAGNKNFVEISSVLALNIYMGDIITFQENINHITLSSEFQSTVVSGMQNFFLFLKKTQTYKETHIINFMNSLACVDSLLDKKHLANSLLPLRSISYAEKKLFEKIKSSVKKTINNQMSLWSNLSELTKILFAGFLDLHTNFDVRKIIDIDRELFECLMPLEKQKEIVCEYINLIDSQKIKIDSVNELMKISNLYSVSGKKNPLPDILPNLNCSKYIYQDYALCANKIHNIKNKNRLKVAFCISGQMRGYKTSHPSWKLSRLFKENDVDVFLDTWETIGYKYPTPVHAHRVFNEPFLSCFLEAVRLFGFREIENEFKNLFNFFDVSSVIQEEDIIRMYNPTNFRIEKDNIYAGWDNQRCMFYKIKKCFDLLPNPNEYDLIIKSRPDKPLKTDKNMNYKEICLELNSERKIFVDVLPFYHQVGGYSVGDQFWIASPEIAKIYCNTYDWLLDDNVISKNILHNKFKSHKTIGYHLSSQAINCISSDDIKFYSLQDPSRMQDDQLYDLVKKDLLDIKNDNIKKIFEQNLNLLSTEVLL